MPIKRIQSGSPDKIRSKFLNFRSNFSLHHVTNLLIIDRLFLMSQNRAVRIESLFSDIANLPITEDSLSILVTVALAAGLSIKPCHATSVVTPVGQCEDHTFVECFGHLVDIVRISASVIVVSSSLLNKLDMDLTLCEGCVLSIGLACVNGTTVWAEAWLPPVPSICSTATSITVADIATRGLITLMRSGLRNVLIGFNKIHFLAPDACDFIGIAVESASASTVWLPA